MVYIEHDGVLYRGVSRGNPREIWSIKEQKFVPYKDTKERSVAWGTLVSEDVAQEMMAEK